jgi:hypothetical protein
MLAVFAVFLFSFIPRMTRLLDAAARLCPRGDDGTPAALRQPVRPARLRLPDYNAGQIE